MAFLVEAGSMKQDFPRTVRRKF